MSYRALVSNDLADVIVALDTLLGTLQRKSHYESLRVDMSEVFKTVVKIEDQFEAGYYDEVMEEEDDWY